MKKLLLLAILLLPAVTYAQPPGVLPVPAPLNHKVKPHIRAKSPVKRLSPNQAQQQAIARAAIGDMAGGRVVPSIILHILAKPNLDPVTAYILWQAARHPMDNWTIKQLEQITAILPTLAESGFTSLEMKLLYKFYGLDPNNLFNPLKFGGSWQLRSMIFDPHYGASPTSISSAECAQSYWVITVAIFKACFLQPKR